MHGAFLCGKLCRYNETSLSNHVKRQVRDSRDRRRQMVGAHWGGCVGGQPQLSFASKGCTSTTDNYSLSTMTAPLPNPCCSVIIAVH